MKPKAPRYHVTISASGGWLVWEESQAIAYCANEAAARAVCQALNLQRAMLVTFSLRPTAPRGHYLN